MLGDPIFFWPFNQGPSGRLRAVLRELLRAVRRRQGLRLPGRALLPQLIRQMGGAALCGAQWGGEGPDAATRRASIGDRTKTHVDAGRANTLVER